MAQSRIAKEARMKLGGTGFRKLGRVWEKIDDYALPAAGFMIGGPAGAAVGSAAARGIGDGKFNPGATLAAGAKGYALGQAGQMAGLRGGQGLRVLGGGAGASPAVATAAGSGGGWGNAARTAGKWALDNPEILLAGANTIGGLDAQRKAGRNEKKMLEQVEREYAERAPLRQMGLRNLTREMEPLDLSVYRNRYNPFS